MSALSVRPVGAEAFKVIATLYRSAFDDPWPEPSLRELLSAFGTWGFVAVQGQGPGEDNPMPVGFLLARVVADEAEILSIGVSPECRRAGVAQALLGVGMQKMASDGARKVFLEVGTDNAAAMALYLKLGFSQVGLRKNYYHRADGSHADALVLQKLLLEAFHNTPPVRFDK